MIHYHGTPVGGKSEDAVRFLSGRHAFVSFAEPKNLGVALEVCQSVAIDNGAFTTWKQGREFSPAAFYDWLDGFRHHPSFDWFLIPDVIDGGEDENDRLIDECPFDFGVPVFHFHESLSRLDRLVDSHRLVALGSSGAWPNPGSTSWWRRLDSIMNVACVDGAPRTKLHGLRMLDPAIFSSIPLSSADSTNAVRNADNVRRFGQYVAPNRGQRASIIADRIEAHNSASIYRRESNKLLFEVFDD